MVASSVLTEGRPVRRAGAAWRKAALAASLALTLGGCLGYDGDIQHGYIMDERLMDQVRVGSSAEQVLIVMGSPSTTSTVGGSAWYYVSQKTSSPFAFNQPHVDDQRIFAVYFDKGKKVERVANYGLQDGRVFDFTSRTTPTAGSESDFLRTALGNLLRF